MLADDCTCVALCPQQKKLDIRKNCMHYLKITRNNYKYTHVLHAICMPATVPPRWLKAANQGREHSGPQKNIFNGI